MTVTPGSLYTIGPRTVRVVANRHGMVARNWRGAIAVRNVATNRLTYVRESRLTELAPTREPVDAADFRAAAKATEVRAQAEYDAAKSAEIAAIREQARRDALTEAIGLVKRRFQAITDSAMRVPTAEVSVSEIIQTFLTKELEALREKP